MFRGALIGAGGINRTYADSEYKNMTLRDLIEGIVLHAFDGKQPFSTDTRQVIVDIKRIYKLDLSAEDSHNLREQD